MTGSEERKAFMLLADSVMFDDIQDMLDFAKEHGTVLVGRAPTMIEGTMALAYQLRDHAECKDLAYMGNCFECPHFVEGLNEDSATFSFSTVHIVCSLK